MVKIANNGIFSAPRRLFHKPWLTLLAAIGFLPAQVHAIGLGAVSGQAFIGAPFTLEVPLGDAGTISSECIELSPHPSGSDSQFFPRNAKTTLQKKSGDGQTVVVIRSPEFNQPVLEFRLAITCGTHIARDYVLFVNPSRELSITSAPMQKALSLPVTEPSPFSKQQAGIRSGPALKTITGPSLDQMAGSRFPHQPKARAKFKKLLREANPEVLQGIADDAPIPLEVKLAIPDYVPRRSAPRITANPTPAPQTAGPVAAETTPPAPVAEQPRPATQEKQPPAPRPRTEPSKDRLSISSTPVAADGKQTTSPATSALQEKAEASFSAQEEMTAKLAKAEASYNEVKELLLKMESRMAALEKERDRLQKENLKQSESSLVELALMVAVGGLIGAALMIVLQRRRRQSNDFQLLDVGDFGIKR